MKVTVTQVPKLIKLIEAYKSGTKSLAQVEKFIQNHICSHGIYDRVEGRKQWCSGCGLMVKNDKYDPEMAKI